MAKKKQKKSNNIYIYIIIGVFLSVFVISAIIYITINGTNKKLDDEFAKEGYNTTPKDAFYRRVVTNNTLDDYYRDMQSETDSEYQEFYYSKQSNEFIELKMLYKNKVSTSLNISTNLETGELTYNYELAYKTAHLLLDGSSKENYNCNVIDNNKVQPETIKNYCDLIIDEINDYNTVKEELLKNNQIRDLSQDK